VNSTRLRLGLPFLLVHVACLGVFVVGWSAIAVSVALILYVVRAFGITAVYHRGLAHRAYRMGRTVRLVGVLVAASAAQRGPLWWVGRHRIHHHLADQPGDPHSPRQVGFWRAHTGWQFARENLATPYDQVPDLAAAPELRFLDRHHYLAPAGLATACFALGAMLARVAPGLGTDGPQMLVWGFAVSTVLLWHVTFSVNSFAHVFGRRPFATRDTSRNNVLVALLAMGEGWHNNHHRYAASARHGFFRFQVDATHALLRVLARLRLVSDLRPVPAALTGGAGRAFRDASLSVRPRRRAPSRA
jgi:stearoyl-CoA desaturase (Delta-9 desaturase)